MRRISKHADIFLNGTQIAGTIQPKNPRNVVTKKQAEADDRCGSCARHAGDPHEYNCPENPLPGRVYDVFLSNGHYDESWFVRARNKRDARKFVWAAWRRDKEAQESMRLEREFWDVGQRFCTKHVETFDSTLDGLEKDEIRGMLDDYREDLDKLTTLGKAVCYSSGT